MMKVVGLKSGIPIWGTCTPEGTFAYLQGYSSEPSPFLVVRPRSVKIVDPGNYCSSKQEELLRLCTL